MSCVSTARRRAFIGFLGTSPIVVSIEGCGRLGYEELGGVAVGDPISAIEANVDAELGYVDGVATDEPAPVPVFATGVPPSGAATASGPVQISPTRMASSPSAPSAGPSSSSAPSSPGSVVDADLDRPADDSGSGGAAGNTLANGGVGGSSGSLGGGGVGGGDAGGASSSAGATGTFGVGGMEGSGNAVGAAGTSGAQRDTGNEPGACTLLGSETQVAQFGTNDTVGILVGGDGSLSWTGAVGNPDLGALEFQNAVGGTSRLRRTTAGDFTGHVLLANVLLESGDDVTLQLYARSVGVPSPVAYGDLLSPQVGAWYCLRLNIDEPSTAEATFDPTRVSLLGMEVRGTGGIRLYVDQVAY